MSEERRRVICLIVGRNETTLLKFLNNNGCRFRDGFLDSDVVFNHCQEHSTLKYESNFHMAINRLLRKKLIETNENSQIRISQKGILFLEIIKDEVI